MDADKWTDKELLKIEKELDAIYKQASEETAKRAKDFFDKYKVEDAEQKKKVQSGEITESQYKKWRRTQLMQGNQYNAMKRQTAMDLTHANERAMAYVNNQLPKVYVANYNAVKSSVDGIGGYSFTLVNEDAVKHVYQNIDKTLLPIKDVNKTKDVAWNSKRINSQILQGIIQGDSIDKISDRLKKATGMTEGAAVRNARTAVTGAQNRGRLDSFERCEDDGIEIKKEWVATLDMRTRPEHGELDGQSIPIDEPFENGFGKIMYPGDPDADPANVYNCRCTLKGDVGQRRSEKRMARDENGHSVLVEDMTYEEWYEAKYGGNIFDSSDENVVRLDIEGLHISEERAEATERYGMGMSDEDREKFNEIFGKAEIVESEDGSYFENGTVHIGTNDSEGTTLFHECTHWYDEKQGYELSYPTYHAEPIFDEDGNYLGRKFVEDGKEVIGTDASFSEYIKWNWELSPREGESLRDLDMSNIGEKLGLSDTWGVQYNENISSDVNAINSYLEAHGVSKSDEDFVHLSDFISAMTWDTNLGSLTTGGHSYDYWTRGYNQTSEITAGYNILRARGREDLLVIEKDLAPNLMKMIETEWAKIW